jgi:hypothetical protein
LYIDSKIYISMSVKYFVKEKINPLNEQVTINRYTFMRSTGEVDLKSLGNEISKRCAVACADTLAVSDASLSDRLFPRGLSPTSTDTPPPPGRGGQVFRYKALIILD